MAAKCNIMCDSTCDFTAAQAAEKNVRILPFHYVEADRPDGGLSGDDDLFQSRSAHEFYDAIRRGACPMTSQPSQLEYDEAFREAYESGVPTVLFCISSGISGGYEGALMSLQRLKDEHPDEEVRIYVVDSLLASTALTLFLDEACAQRDAGLNAEQLAMWAEEARYHVHTLFMVDNLDALHRGGRLPKGVAVIGDALDVKALLHFNLDGTLGIRAVARGRKKGMQAGRLLPEEPRAGALRPRCRRGRRRCRGGRLQRCLRAQARRPRDARPAPHHRPDHWLPRRPRHGLLLLLGQ